VNTASRFIRNAIPDVIYACRPTTRLCRVLLCTKQAEPLHAESAQQVEGQLGRFDRPLHPERFSGQGQGVELATGTGGQIYSDAEALLAEGETTFDPRWQLETTGGNKGSVNPVREILGGGRVSEGSASPVQYFNHNL
jgi:hypothetical protein